MSIPPSKRLKRNPVHIIIRQTDTPMRVIGIIRYIVRSYDCSVSEIGEINAAIQIDNSGSVIFEPIKVPIATP